MTPAPEPSAPRSLSDPAQLVARRGQADAAHVVALRALACRIAHDRAAEVPDPDPLDGGTGARLLLLLETPGPGIGRTGFVSRDNPTGTAANLFRFLASAGIPRRDSLIWNAIPWVIHAPGALNRAPRRPEIAAAGAYLAPLLDLLPGLAVVVLAGRVAGLSREPLLRLRPDLPVVAIPHPSPTFVCTSPSVAMRIADGLAEAAAMLGTGVSFEPDRTGDWPSGHKDPKCPRTGRGPAKARSLSTPAVEGVRDDRRRRTPTT